MAGTLKETSGRHGEHGLGKGQCGEGQNPGEKQPRERRRRREKERKKREFMVGGWRAKEKGTEMH